MTEYKRLTKEKSTSENTKPCYDNNGNIIMSKELFELLIEEHNQLWQIENLIENGTLIELPRIIHPNKAEWYVQYQYPSGVIQYDICFSEAEAEQKLKELKEV